MRRPSVRPFRLAGSLVVVGCLFVLAACAARTDGPVGDLVELPQDAGAYHGLAPDAPLLGADVQQGAYARFLAAHFAPWERSRPVTTVQDAFWGLDRFSGKVLYGENTLARDPGWLARMRAASRMDDYPSMSRRAVAVTDTGMRALPSSEPVFYQWGTPGEGYPFDYMQNSLVLAGTPLYADHLSADGQWVLVESRYTYGWVPVRDVAWVDDAFAEAYRTGVYAAVTRDREPVRDEDGRFLFDGEVGMVLPVLEAGTEGLVVAAPARDDRGNAVLHRARLGRDVAAIMPLAPTPANFARLANAMLGRPYGWGGLYGDRDCSALTMDLMAPFGIFLPRNSSQQARAGVAIPLEGLTRAVKKQIILDYATPFLTLVRKPGHIMLYIGRHDGRPVVLHALWGLRTGSKGAYGRKVVGGAVITTLEPGLERSDLARPGGILLETVGSIVVLPGPGPAPSKPRP
ncbi:NlpC/P60 family N-terminal domain-containing protein [Pseudodesulfovibrio sp.]|uniref:NlpC/P60 family N-terminal domain-containing protein n=1 Tax=Pseudodesulfovibrio sp. TaxID=2035812 RepID=UPI002602572E|nr:NlpC/P60 family N-terminal domain-containing protein [Pseudodesulfovibrio sp.]MDD3311933.1 NlpC/P60 family N-terminal domain-containing protein [Pseudodesulfovibrio sp.]